MPRILPALLVNIVIATLVTLSHGDLSLIDYPVPAPLAPVNDCLA